MGSKNPYNGLAHISPNNIYRRNGFKEGYQDQNLFSSVSNVTKGFLDENLVALGLRYMVGSILNNNKAWEKDDSYNVLDDPQLIGLEQYYGRFMHSRSKAHTTELVEEFMAKQRDVGNSPAYIVGRVLGGIFDPSNLLLFTRAGRTLLTGSRMARGTKYGLVGGTEEMVGKRYFDHTRPMHESMIITAAQFVVPALFPALRTTQGNKAALKFDKSADELDSADDAIYTKTRGVGASTVDPEEAVEVVIKGEKVVLNVKNIKPSTLKYNTKKYDDPMADPDGPFWITLENAKTGKAITVKAYRGQTSEIGKDAWQGPIDLIAGGAEEGFTMGGNYWTLSKGVASNYSENVIEATLKINNPVVINTAKDYYKFISTVLGKSIKTEKEAAVFTMLGKDQLVKKIAQYMKSSGHDAIIINGKRNDIIKTMIDQNQIIVFGRPKKTVKETAKQTFEREADEALNRIEPTFLGWLGEAGPWNPIFRTFKNKILVAQEFMEHSLETHLHQVKNKLGIATAPSIERKVKMRYTEVLTLHSNMNEMYNKYLVRSGANKQNWAERLINQKFIRGIDEAGNKILSPTQFNEAMWKAAHGLIDDTIPEEAITAASKYLKPFYDNIGKQYAGLKIVEHYLEGQLKFFNKILQQTQQFDKFKHIRDQLQRRLDFVKEHGPLLKNYKTNIVYKRDQIKARFEEFKTILRNELPSATQQQIDELAEQFLKYQPVISFDSLIKRAEKAIQSGKAIDMEDFVSSVNKVSARFHSRDLNISYKALANAGFIETDVSVLTKMYFNQTVPDIEITRVFGDPMGLGQRYVEGGGFRKGIQQVIDEYDKLIAKASSVVEKDKLIKLKNEAVDDSDAAIGLIRGTYGLADDPNRSFSRNIRMVKLYNAFTMLTGIAQTADVARLIAIQGIVKTFRSAMEIYTSGIARDILRRSKNTTQLGGEATDLATSTTAMRQYDIQDAFGVYNKFERGWSSLGNLYFTFINLSNPWNASVKTIAGLFNGTRLLEACEKLYLGKTLARADQMRLSNLGIKPDQAIDIWKQYVRFGIGKGGRTSLKEAGTEYKVIRLANTEEWEDKALADVFHHAIGKQANIDVVTPGKGDIPLWANTEMGGVLTQFKKFGMASTQRMLMRGLQERDAKQMQGFLLLVAAGMMIDAFRQRQFGRSYAKKPLGQKIVDGLDRSGLIGIYSDINNALERMTNNEIGMRPALGSKKPYGTYRDFMKEPVKASLNMPLWDIGGPTASQFANIADIAWTWGNGKYNHPTARNVRRLVPFQNVWWLDSLFDRLEKNVLYKRKNKQYKRKTVRNTIFKDIYKGPKRNKELEVQLLEAKEKIKTLRQSN